jgi:hypothetical protein
MVYPHHVSLGKCTSDTMVDVVMDFTDVVMYWMVGGLDGHQMDANHCLLLPVWGS